jgi:Putative DNA-binding domain
MNLQTTQELLQQALWGEVGSEALQSADKWEQFLSDQKSQLSHYQGQYQAFSLYEELLQSTVHDTLSNIFPFCEKLLRSDWYALCESYRRQFPNRSYQLYRCAEKFPDFLAEQTLWMERYPFLSDLAQYEWIEVAVENDREQSLPVDFIPFHPETPEQLSTICPIWNQASDLRTFWYNVPQIIQTLEKDNSLTNETSPWENNLDVELQLTLLFIFRDPANHRARFFELNHLTAQLIEISMLNPHVSYEITLNELQANSPALTNISLKTLRQEGLGIFSTLHKEGILLGSLPL